MATLGEMETTTLHSYDDIWPIIIRQHVTNSVMFGVPFVMATDEKTLIYQLKPQLKVSEKYKSITDGSIQETIALLTQDRKRCIVSEVIYCPSRKWNSKENRDTFMLSMVLRAYFERPDTFGWSRDKVIQWFKGVPG